MRRNFNLRYFIQITFFGLFFSLSFFSCKKKTELLKEQYQGNYYFVYNSESWQMNGPRIKITEKFIGGVQFIKDDQIRITKGTDPLMEVKVDIEGNLISLQCEKLIGKLENKNSITVNYSSNTCPGGGLGGGINYSLSGTKM